MTDHMRLHRNRRSGSVLLAALIAVGMTGLLVAPSAGSTPKPRVLLILPFGVADPGSEDTWIGEGLAESLHLAFATVPGVITVERARLKQLAQPDSWDEPAATAAARTLRADIAIHGEVRRVGGDVTIQPRYVELRAERAERGTLEVVSLREGALPERTRSLPVAYARALKITVSEAAAARMQALAAPTPIPRAWEAYVRGQLAAAATGQSASETAIELLGRAVELDPKFAVAQYALGRVHQGLGNRWKAAAQFRASTQLDPAFPEAYKALGDLFITAPRRLFDQAIEAYNRALELRPFYSDAHVGLGDARGAKGDVNGAIAAYQKALAHNPLNARVHASLGKIYYAEKNLYYESVNAYKKALELDPASVEARMGLAEVYEDKGLYQDAIGEYRKVIDQQPRNTQALYNLANVFEKVDAKEAIALWERYIEIATPIAAEKDWVETARLHLRKLRNQQDKGR